MTLWESSYILWRKLDIHPCPTTSLLWHRARYIDKWTLFHSHFLILYHSSPLLVHLLLRPHEIITQQFFLNGLQEPRGVQDQRLEESDVEEERRPSSGQSSLAMDPVFHLLRKWDLHNAHKRVSVLPTAHLKFQVRLCSMWQGYGA